MVGIADLASLLVRAVVTLYFSGFLVEQICVFSGNMDLVASLDTHFLAKFRLR